MVLMLWKFCGATVRLNPYQKPYIVLLDLNMPKMNDIEFLHEVRALADRWQRGTSQPYLFYPVGAAMIDKRLCRSELGPTRVGGRATVELPIKRAL